MVDFKHVNAVGDNTMKLANEHKLPLCMIGLSVFVSVILLILPVDKILVTYQVVNSVKTVEYVSKSEGIFKLVVSALVVYVMWILRRRKHRLKCEQNPDMVSHRLRRGFEDLFFSVIGLVPVVAGIISIVIWLCGLNV